MHAHVPFNLSHERINYLYKENKHTKRVLVVFCELFLLETCRAMHPSFPV